MLIPMSAEHFLAQAAKQPETPLSVEGAWAKAILDAIEVAEKMHPAGSYDHGAVLGAALVRKWPQIKPLLTRMIR